MLRIILAVITLFFAQFCAASTFQYEECYWLTVERIINTEKPEYLREYVKNCLIDSNDHGLVLIIDSLGKVEEKYLMIEFTKRLLLTPNTSRDEPILYGLTLNIVFNWTNLDWIKEVLSDETLRRERRFDFLEAAFERGRTDQIELILEELSYEDWNSARLLSILRAPIHENNYEIAVLVLKKAIANGTRLPTSLTLHRNLYSSQREYLDSLLITNDNK